ncbi:hypothetical protein GWN42_05005 [candidate division KSB1 bacterium]|nr:hypothetical protein [Phycisphaerae bacterium]NIV92162.1 hypothetical protein [candidate division KSB1 bacterium]
MAVVEGLGRVIRNLDKELRRIENVTMKGLIRGSIIIRRSMDDNAPSIPVDLGNLRASWFTVTSEGQAAGLGSRAGIARFRGPNKADMVSDHHGEVGKYATEIKGRRDPLLIMGFTAYYATYVHEMVGANFKQPKTGAMKAATGAKFFEAALKREEKAVFNVIKSEARIK